ncbi:MAG: TIR domain-containing protein [Hyphomicrobiaceae bacterium]|nr:TIR domain-containing protein [Hyphomicrobiaceae bacterium]
MTGLREVLRQAKAEPGRAVFISRAGADPRQRLLAGVIAEILRRLGYIVILQDDHFQHADFLLAMDRVLAAGPRVLAIVSREYLESDHCMKEAVASLGQDQMNAAGHLVVLRIDDERPRGLLQNIVSVDFRDAWQRNDQKEMEALLLKALGRPKHSRAGQSNSELAAIQADFEPNNNDAGRDAKLPIDAGLLQERSFEHFLRAIDLSTVERIAVIATVGNVTIRQLRTVLKEKAKSVGSRSIDVDVLLSSSAQSSAKRASGLKATIDGLKNFASEVTCFKVQVRTYASPPIFRGTIVEHVGGETSGYVAYYYWGSTEVHRNASFAAGNGVSIKKGDAANPLLPVVRSWFDHFWGNGAINTILFDFDDTIFDTTDAQVGAWVRAIQALLDCGAVTADAFRAPLREAILAKQDLLPLMRDIFLDEQNANLILRRIMAPDPAPFVLDFINKNRTAARTLLTKDGSQPISMVLEDIKALAERYRLVIVSATSEQLIEDVLQKHRLGGLFSYVFGRSADEFDSKWEGVEAKAQRFIRIAAMLGIPLDRMAFVGDSDSDYRAARQLGVEFIENRYNAIKNGRKTLLREGGSNHLGITGSKAGELIDCVNRIEAAHRSSRTV